MKRQEIKIATANKCQTKSQSECKNQNTQSERRKCRDGKKREKENQVQNSFKN